MAVNSKNKAKVSVVEVIWPYAQSIALEQGLELVDIEYIKEAGQWVLRVYIDREQGVDHDCCSNFSNAFSVYLDNTDPIPTSYVLEVSSPGIERPLKKDEDFQRFKGQQVHISLYSPIDGIKEYQGELIGLKEDSIIIKVESGEDVKEVAIPREQVGKAHLVAVL